MGWAARHCTSLFRRQPGICGLDRAARRIPTFGRGWRMKHKDRTTLDGGTTIRQETGDTPSWRWLVRGGRRRADRWAAVPAASRARLLIALVLLLRFSCRRRITW